MPPTPLHDQVRALVDAFVHNITELVRTAAFEALDEALGGVNDPSPTRASRSSTRREPARSTVEVIMTPAPAGRVTPARSEPAPSSIPRRHLEFDELEGLVDPEELADTIVRLLVERPGLRAEEMARMLGSDTTDVKPALATLKADGRVVAGGKARGTRYTVADQHGVEGETVAASRRSSPSTQYA